MGFNGKFTGQPPIFDGKNHGFQLRFSLFHQSIEWCSPENSPKSLCFTRISGFTNAQLDQKLVVLAGKFDLYLACSVQFRASAKRLLL